MSKNESIIIKGLNREPSQTKPNPRITKIPIMMKKPRNWIIKCNISSNT